MMRTLTELRRPADTHIAALGSSLEELRRSRLELAEKVAGLTWDLGGLTYEMAVRDHYRLDVLARRAAELQEADAQLGEVERLLAAAEDGIHGTCRACGSVHSRGAAFCWHCGATLLADSHPSVLGQPVLAQESVFPPQESDGDGAESPPAFRDGAESPPDL